MFTIPWRVAFPTLLLLASVLPLHDVTAHRCVDTDPWACDPSGCEDGTYHDHAIIEHEDISFCSSDAQNCPTQWTHTYGSMPFAAMESRSVLFTEPLGVVSVWHATTADCDGDGIPGGWDGDYEQGFGGAFFGWGPWADEPICDYDLNVHGGNVVVDDVIFGGQVGFVVGENDQAGPVFITDPVTGEAITCETDGTIWVSVDGDDCVSPLYFGVGATCGWGGGDGGFWVFPLGIIVQDNPALPQVSAATTGTITAF